MSPYKDVSDLVLLSAVLSERNRQRDMYSGTHDQHHDGGEWVALLTMYLGKAAAAEFGGGPREFEKRMIQVAALAMAAIEWEAKRQ